MPLLDHFHPPLHGPRRWEGFHHAWAKVIAQHLNQEILPPDYFAEPEINVGPELDSFEIRAYQDVGGTKLRAAIDLISPANKDRTGSRRTFAAKCAGYLEHGIAVVIVDIVTARTTNLHAELFKTLDVKSTRTAWQSATNLYAAAYRPVTTLKTPHVETWLETLTLGKPLPDLPLWLTLDLCVPVRLEGSYLETCRSLRISA